MHLHIQRLVHPQFKANQNRTTGCELMSRFSLVCDTLSVSCKQSPVVMYRHLDAGMYCVIAVALYCSLIQPLLHIVAASGSKSVIMNDNK